MKKFFLNTFSSLKHKNFRYFWFGQCISIIGTWIQRTAQAWLVYQLTDSPFLLGILGVFQFGPVLLFSLFAGVIADRLPKRKLMIFNQVVFMIQSGILTALVLTGHIKYWHILLLAALFGCVQTLDVPTKQAFFIDLVGKEDLMNAISLNSTIVNLARIFGPLIAGVAMMKLGAGYCFLLNTVTFIPAILGLYLIDTGNSAANRAKGNILHDIKEGLLYIKNNEILKTTIIVIAIVGTFIMNTDVIIPVFTKTILGKGEAAYSQLLAAFGVGSFTGAVVMAQRSRKGLNKIILYGNAVLMSVLYILVSFTPNFILSLFLMAAIGFCLLTFLNMGNSTLQLNSSNEYRGRVMSIYTLVFLGSTPIGNFFTGSVMEHFGGNSGFLVCGGVTLFLIVIVLILNKRRKPE